MDEKYKENAALLLKAQTGDEEAVTSLLKLNAGLVRSIALRYTGRGTDFEDLEALGNMGLLKAIRSFDAARGCAFSTYAVPLIFGEIRRFLRDDGPIKVSRVHKRTGAMLSVAREALAAEGITDPPLSLLAERAGITAEAARDALEALTPPRSLGESPLGEEGGATLEEMLSDGDGGEAALEKIALRAAIEKLPALKRKILLLRYFRDLSQVETARMLGLSQVKVSREEKKILLFLREELS
ncbi:MAG: sigma-70 family RNA polymerase sigma factor [Ruminococcaceae bacterium]|nr:sigma-70 family RNA polymerase sigma factor [Oscillospiraceae bacterium]